MNSIRKVGLKHITVRSVEVDEIYFKAELKWEVIVIGLSLQVEA